MHRTKLPMNSLATFLSPLAMLMTVAMPGHHGPVMWQAAAESPDMEERPPLGLQPPLPEPLRVLEQARRTPEQAQVRIEQRVIIRITPGPPQARDRLLSDLPRRPMPQRFQEEKIKDCVPVGAIVGVQPANENRLLLFMRDQRILTAALEKACNAHDFYSGFYIERSEDGKLCTGRDHLQSRAGSRCKVEQFNRLIAISD